MAEGDSEGEEINYDEELDYDSILFYNGTSFSDEDRRRRGGGSVASRKKKIEHQIDINVNLMEFNNNTNENLPKFGISHKKSDESFQITSKLMPENTSIEVSVYLLETILKKHEVSVNLVDLRHDEVKPENESTKQSYLPGNDKGFSS